MIIPSAFDAFLTSDFSKVVAELSKVEPKYVSLDDLKAIESTLGSEHKASLEYARKIVSPTAFIHSIRCYYFALAILHGNFPSNTSGVRQITFEELNNRVYHTSMLHDLGITTDAEAWEHPASGMSFELHGGFMAYEHLHAHAPSLDKHQVGDITQSIIIHTLPLTAGIASAVGMLIRLAAMFDALGYDAFGPNSLNIIHRDTVREIEKVFPRGELAGGVVMGIFAKEAKEKPDCLMSHVPKDLLVRSAAIKALVSD